ncbi:MAG: GxxExxY protein [Phycisphaerae bacterium]|nr:GxxExxY protein [Phycisphaerae bacterium]
MEGKERAPGRHIEVTDAIIGAAIVVHRALSAGFVEAVYEKALCHELAKRGLHVERQKVVKVFYDGVQVGEHRIDMLVEDVVVVELKAVERFLEVHTAQILSTMKAAQKNVGLLLNFKQAKLVDGIKRVSL